MAKKADSPVTVPYLVELYGQDGVRRFIKEQLDHYDRLIARVEEKLKNDRSLSPRSQMLALKQIGQWVSAKADLVLRNELIAPAPKQTGNEDKRSTMNFYIGSNVPIDHPLLAGEGIQLVGDAGHEAESNNGTASKGKE